MKSIMNGTNNELKNDEQTMLITKDSLRPPRKRQRTRSTTHTECPKGKEDMKDLQIEVNEKESEATVQTKNRRQWGQWSGNDIECFFKGLAEYGKDFTSIQLHMKKKQRSKHDDDVKTKEQIRHFYHRTWAKLAKSLNLAQETNQKKAYRRELHYMLCLGELRKRGTTGLGKKVLTQLHELVTKGATYIRHNSRNIRVRLPNRYLKKLYRDENSVEDVLLPKHVNIEFLPNSNSAFNYVQMHAFNPRIRFVNVNINSKFSEVFELFDKRFTDLCPEGQELTLYPVLSGDVDYAHFAEVITNVEDTLGRHDTVTTVEQLCTPNEDLVTISPNEDVVTMSPNEDVMSVFPKVFGQGRKSSTEAKRKFLGYWTQSIADEIHVRNLYLALGKLIPMKFRYEWKNSEERIPPLAADSLKYLRGYCIQEKPIKEPEDISGKMRAIIPKKIETESEPITYCPPMDALSLPVNNHSPLPLRPRPGRQRGKRNILNSQMCLPKNRAGNLNSSVQQLSNAVAVNIIPQPPGLEQFNNQLPHNTCAKISMSNANLNTQPVKGILPNLNTQPVKSILPVTNSVVGPIIQEEVIDESMNSHFKSLATLLASSALNQNRTKDIKEYLMLKTPTKKPSSNSATAPLSPNLEWINIETSGCFQALINDMASTAGLKVTHGNQDNDPRLPVFHSGDTSQEPFGMSFDLSSQGDFKMKDDYG